MSTPEELIRAGRASLVLDSNVTRSFSRLKGICNRVLLLNEPPHALALRMCIPSVVHMETLAYLRRERSRQGKSYDAREVARSLQDLSIQFISFDEHHADHAAELLARQYPDEAAWREAKCNRCRRCLGLHEVHQPSGKRCSATIDWLVAAQGHQEGWILVTDDQGEKFAGVERKMKLAALESFLDTLLAPTP